MLVASGRAVETDKKFEADQNEERFINHHFVRLTAVNRTFVKVDFKYSTFDACYLRNCKFDSCDFTGCRFVGTNLYGSQFSGCAFDYALFEKTHIDPDVLATECPGKENLKARFARSLRTNFQQLGDADAANQAMRVELSATETHLYKEWRSNESYYRKKYRGLRRAKSFVNWVKFVSLDFVWGNGESTYRLVRFALIVLCLMAVYDVFLQARDSARISSYVRAFFEMPQIFLGVSSPASYPKWYLAITTLLRLILIGFFMAIVIKRFNRR